MLPRADTTRAGRFAEAEKRTDDEKKLMVYVETADDIDGLISGPITHLHDEGKQGMRITFESEGGRGTTCTRPQTVSHQIERGC
jgi:hypothetical protein